MSDRANPYNLPYMPSDASSFGYKKGPLGTDLWPDSIPRHPLYTQMPEGGWYDVRKIRLNFRTNILLGRCTGCGQPGHVRLQCRNPAVRPRSHLSV